MPLLSLSMTSGPLLALLWATAAPPGDAFLLPGRFGGRISNEYVSYAYTTSALQSTPFSGSGWDNDSFLDSLSKPQEEPISWGPPLATTNAPEDPYSPPPTAAASVQQQQQQQQQQQPQMQQPPPGMYSPPPPSHPVQQQYQPAQPQYTGYLPPPPAVVASEAANPVPETEDENNDDLPAGDIEGAAMTEEMKAKIKAANEAPEEEASQGGERFRKLMERARQQQQKQQQAYGSQSPPPQQQPAPLQIPPDAFNLPVEEQARLFRELMARQQMQQLQPAQPQYQPPPPPPPSSDPYQQQYAQMMQQYPQQQQQQQQQQPPPPPQPYPQQYTQQPYPQQPYYPPPHTQHPQYVVPQMAPNVYHPQTSPHSNYLEPGVGFDGRKIGRNRDADTIANTADAYLAQLKRDSTTRNLARYAGDEQKANDVFHDPAIKDIQAPELNPYLEEQRRKERDMLETVPEEMLVFQDYHGEDAGDKSYSGVSYKDRVAQLKAKRKNDNQ